MSREMRALGLALWAFAGGVAGADPGVLGGWSVRVGAFDANDNPRLSNQDGDGALALGGTWQATRHFALGVDLHSYGQEFDSGIGGAYFLSTAGDRMRIDTSALAVQALLASVGPRVSVYGGGGAGAYRTELTIEGTVLGIPGEVVSESDTSFGMHAFAGVGWGFTEQAFLDLQWRRTYAFADFGQYSHGEVDVGGQFLFVGFQHVIRPE